MTDEELAALNTALAALNAGIRSGVLSVRHGETSTTYRSLGEMKEAAKDLAALINGRTRKVRYGFQGGKGL